MNTALHFASRSAEWETPPDLFKRLDAQYHFTLDVCATAENAKCPAYLYEAVDGLSKPWDGVCWMNPPYGRQIGRGVRKAYESAQAGATVVCLLPARTDTAWWHDYCMKGQVTFLRGRLTFVGAKHPAPFPSAIVVFEPKEPT